ncbi:DNA polymerase beta subunit [Ignisphaera aggregans DSM 17230]|uniref:DNA polymerase beta subunit n=1 Tax=Ignisphaera aggregans (strain DSM 17230 / JCM 13409 / AQ1.S1) TaxID=583356 RepID=E0STL5_IGNAA|nr:DNA polymerase beta subunit [Ignisphaera aggregans DSM 17230]
MVETKLQLLRRWRNVVEIVARVVGELYPEAEVYLFGGAAEGRLTVLI